MAEERQSPDIDETLELTEEVATPDDDRSSSPDDEGDEEEIPTFGDTIDEAQDTDNATIKHLRQVARDALKRAAEAEAKATAPRPQTVEVGEKPTLAGCDYDEEKFESELDAWKERKSAADKQKTTTELAQEEQRKAWEARLTKVTAEKASLGRADTEEAFDTVGAALGEQKIAAVLQLLDDTTNAAAFVYALSKHPDQLSALASQDDPVRLVKDITRLEGQLKMVKRKAPPGIDTPERGSGKTVHPKAVDKELAKLEKEAETNGGDRTKIAAFKRQHGLT